MNAHSTSSLAFHRSPFVPRAEQRLSLMQELHTPTHIPTTPGWDLSVAVKIGTDSCGSKKQISRRTLGDELADKVASQARPSTRAIRLANALLLEQILETGRFRSPAALAEKIGISRSVMSDLLALLDTPVHEMERILFETA